MTHPSAVVFVIIDGLSDIAPHLRRTSLPVLNTLSKHGRVGLIDPVSPGLACGSDTAHLSLFGYPPIPIYRGRGALEALGAGLRIRKGDVAFKCNFAWMDSHRCVVRRCPGTGPQMKFVAKELARRMDGMIVEEVEVGVFYTGEHRCVIRLRGEGLTDGITDTDPLVDGQPLREAKKITDSGGKCARIVNKLSKKMEQICVEWEGNELNGVRPGVNVVLFRGAAEGLDLEKFYARHGMSAFLIAPTKIISGVGRAAGLEVLDVEGATGGYDTNLKLKGTRCIKEMMKKDCIGAWKWSMGILHVKAVDEAGHEQDVARKCHWLRNVDEMLRHMMSMLVGKGRTDVVFAVTGDHTTPTAFGDHTCEPVPIVVADSLDADARNVLPPRFIKSDECDAFDETSAGMFGSLGRFSGEEIMKLMKKLLGKSGQVHCFVHGAQCPPLA